MKYNAFISYRHLPKDKFVAENLHRYLEMYKLPKSLYDKCKNHSIERVFRDKDELPLISDLSEPIDAAIRDSEFLIVICTPQLKESRWCTREIETFKAIHGREKIFAVLADGEPDESFPEALLKEEYEETDENGNVTIKTRFIEPLAADVRGKNYREIKKKIKEESIRLIAPMLGLSYDDLKQRHRERILKRRIMYASVISSVVAVFGIVSTSMAVKISRQNVEIKKNYAKSLVAESENCFKEGNLIPAREKAELALEYDESDQTVHAVDMVYGKTAAVGTFVLSDAYEAEDGVQGMILSPDGATLIAMDGVNQVWDISTADGKKVKLSDNAISFMKGYICFTGDNKLIYNCEKGICVYDTLSKDSKVIPSEFAKFTVNEEGTVVAAVTNGCVTFYNADTLEKVFTVDIGVTSDCAIDFSADGERFMAAVADPDIYRGSVFDVDSTNGLVMGTYKFEGGVPIDICAREDGYVLSLCDTTGGKDTTENAIYCYDSDGKLKWESEKESEVYEYVDYCGAEESGLYSFRPSCITVFDVKTGDKVLEKSILGCAYDTQKLDSSHYVALLTDAEVIGIDVESLRTDTAVNYDVMPILRSSECALHGDELYVHFAGADYISVYRIPTGQEQVAVSENADEYVATKPDGVVFFQDTIAAAYAYDESIARPEAELSSVMIHSDDRQLFACYGGDDKSVRIYKNGDSKPLYSLDINIGMISYMLFTHDASWFVVSYQNGNLELYDAVSGEPVASLDKDYPYIFDVLNLPELDTVIIDTAYDTKILDGRFNEKTAYQKGTDSMCIGYDFNKDMLLLRNGNSVSEVSIK